MKFKILLLLCLVAGMIQAQNFGTLTSTWNHCILPIFESPPLRYDNLTVESVADITFNGLEGNTLRITKTTYYGFPIQDEINIIRDGKKVFYEEDGTLYLLYDFNLNAGDTYQVRYPVKFDSRNIENAEWFEPYIDIKVESVEFVNVGGTILKKQFISTESNLYRVGNYALECIGYEYWILPFYNCDACETYYFNGLIKYKDPNLEVISNDHQCSSLSENVTKRNKLFIHPNPAGEFLNFSGLDDRPIEEITIQSSDGKILLRQDNNFEDINISMISSGVYIVSVKSAGRVFNEKLVIAR